MNTIVFELCAEDRARMDNILAALRELSTPKVEEVKPEQHPVADPFPAPTEVAAPAETARTIPADIKVEEVQAKVVALSAAGKKDAVRAIVKSYAEKVSDIPADKRGEVWVKLCELEG